MTDEPVATGARDEPSRGFPDLLAEWDDVWLESIKFQAYELQHRRELHDGFMAMLEGQDHPDSDIFGDAFHRMYIESQVMVIRRQADDDTRTLSLRRLIGQLEAHRRSFTRTDYTSRWLDGRDPASAHERERLEARMHLQMANDAFDRFTDQPGDEYLGGRRLQQDRADLLSITDAVVRHANASVAHVKREAGRAGVTYAEFHKAIEHLGTMLQRYYLLINQGALVSTTPVIQGDWRGPFRRALVPADD